jgi:hypothetical protein
LSFWQNESCARSNASLRATGITEIDMTRRAIILGATPYINDVYRKNAKTLFDDTGGNAGNLAFMYAVANHVRGARVMHWGAPVQEIRAAGDLIVLALANQLGSHTDLGSAATLLEEFNLPVVGLGLGAQAASTGVDIELKSGTDRWLRTICRLRPSDAPNLGVRGGYTEEQIGRLGLGGAAVVTGCPSNFINMQDDIAASVEKGFKRRPRCIGVTAGIPYLAGLENLERNLAEMATKTGGAYIVQHGLQMLQLARNEFDNMDADVLESCRAYITPHKTLEEFKAWCRQFAYAFYDARSWMDFMRRFDFVVGSRFHGAMLAIQAGVPAACIVHDSRTAEMCETMAIPYRHYGDFKAPISADNVLDYFSFDPDRYRESRRKLFSHYGQIFKGADIEFVRGVGLNAA